MILEKSKKTRKNNFIENFAQKKPPFGDKRGFRVFLCSVKVNIKIVRLFFKIERSFVVYFIYFDLRNFLLRTCGSTLLIEVKQYLCDFK